MLFICSFLLHGLGEFLLLESSCRIELMTMAVIFTTPSFFWVQLNQGIDAHDGYACFYSRFQLLHLAHTWFKHTRFQAVVYFAVGQIEAIIFVVLGLC